MLSCLGENFTSQMEVALFAESFTFCTSFAIRPFKEWVGQWPGQVGSPDTASVNQGSHAVPTCGALCSQASFLVCPLMCANCGGPYRAAGFDGSSMDLLSPYPHLSEIIVVGA